MAESDLQHEDDDFDNLLANAISSVDTLRHLQFQRKNDNPNKGKRKTRGPSPKVVSLKLKSILKMICYNCPLDKLGLSLTK